MDPVPDFVAAWVLFVVVFWFVVRPLAEWLFELVFWRVVERRCGKDVAEAARRHVDGEGKS